MDRQIRKLDDDLIKYEEEFLRGPRNGKETVSVNTPTKRRKERGGSTLTSVRSSPAPAERGGRGQSVLGSSQLGAHSVSASSSSSSQPPPQSKGNRPPKKKYFSLFFFPKSKKL